MWKFLQRRFFFSPNTFRVTTRALTSHHSTMIQKTTADQSRSSAASAIGIASFIIAAAVSPFVAHAEPAQHNTSPAAAGIIKNSNFLSKDFIVDAVSVAAPSVVHISSTTSVGLGFGLMGSAGSGFIISKVCIHFY